MKRFIISAFLILAFFVGESQETSLHKVISQLQTYYQYYPGEKVYLTTNKDVYSPGETIWFSGFVKVFTDDLAQEGSHKLTVTFYNEQGVSIVGDDFQVADGRVFGDFTLPANMSEGLYVISAKSVFAKDANDVFLKEVYVKWMNENMIQVEDVSTSSILKSGSSNKLQFLLKEISGEPAKSTRLKYELKEGNKLLEEGKLKTEKDGMLNVEFSLPKRTFSKPVLLHLFDNAGDLYYAKAFPVNTEKLQLRFYPEGGNFSAGTSILGYCITDGAGKAVVVEGNLVDADGMVLIKSKTLVPGYGIIPFSPEKSKKYQFRITSELGNGQSFELPSVNEEGLKIMLQRVSSEFLQLGLTFPEESDHPVHAMLTKGAKVLWLADMTIKKGIAVKIPKEKLEEGLALFSVFDTDGNCLGQRMVYCNKEDELKLDVEVSDNQLGAGQSFYFNVDLKDETGNPVPGKLITTISSANELYPTMNEFEADFQFNEELENSLPMASLMEKKSTFESSLNYLLVANSFKNFAWEKVLDFEKEQVANSQAGIRGVVIDTKQNPVKNAKVSLVNSTNMQMMTASTDADGEFFFSGLKPENISEYIIKAIDESGREDLNIELAKSFEEKLMECVENFALACMQSDPPRYSTAYFEENPALFKRVNKASHEKNSEPRYKAYLQTATSLAEVIRMIKPYDVSDGKIIFKGGMNSLQAQDGALIVIDGQKVGTNASVLSSISPLDVETIDVYTSPSDIQRFTGLNSVGVIDIHTRRGKFVEEEKDLVNDYENGVRVANDFLEMRSEAEGRNFKTLYWKPDGELDGSSPMNVEVRTGNVVGDFVIDVKALDNKGHVVESRKTIRVTN